MVLSEHNAPFACFNIVPNSDYCQTPGYVFRLGINFVFPLSQEKKSKNKNPHQNLSEGVVLEGWNLTNRLLMGFWLSLGVGVQTPINTGLSL